MGDQNSHLNHHRGLKPIPVAAPPALEALRSPPSEREAVAPLRTPIPLPESLHSAVTNAPTEFDRTPSSIKRELDRHVVGNEAVKRTVSTTIYKHLRRIGKQIPVEDVADAFKSVCTVSDPTGEQFDSFVSQATRILRRYELSAARNNPIKPVIDLLLKFGHESGLATLVLPEAKGRKRSDPGLLDTAVVRARGKLLKALTQSTAQRLDQAPDETKENVLVIGGTGTGKTYTLSTAARMLNIPFVKFDAARLTEAGFVGSDVTDISKELLALAEDDKDLASGGIVCLDEIDKKVSSPDQDQRDISGKGAQQALLRILEDHVDSEGVDYGRVQFFLSGAFSGLADVIRRRLGTDRIGFGSESKTSRLPDEAILRYVEPVDLVAYGFIPELVGRIHKIVVTDPMDQQQILRVLLEPEDSPLRQKQRSLRGERIDLQLTDDAAAEIARRAGSRGVGARSLSTILGIVLEEIEFDAPDQLDQGLRTIVIDREFVLRKFAERAERLAKAA